LEAKWEADRKTKWKVNFLAAALLNSQVGPSRLIQAETITMNSDWCPTLGRNYSQINVPIVIRKGTGRINVPSGPGAPKRPPRIRVRDWVVSPPTGKPMG
jgi:hypothetical protein